MNSQKAELLSSIVELSDMYRRGAAFTNQEAAASIVEYGRRFACAATYLYGEYDADHWTNKEALDKISVILQTIDETAAGSGMPSIELPMGEEDPYAKMIQEHVLDKNSYKVDFFFQDREYKKDLSDMGQIIPQVKTVLDEGVRGMAEIDFSLKCLWDKQVRQGPQLKFELS